MGTIMRGDQTLRLIQLYYNHYPDIARNTQDADGRRLRSQMWQQITNELNTAYDTNFSVEQYKKKIQNVQCTSRQKIQTGKRNLGVAEFEYLRLFEQERLTGNGFNMDAYESLTHSSSSTDLLSSVKMEQMLEQFGITFDAQALTSPLNETAEPGCHSDSDSNTTTTAPSTVPENGVARSPPPASQAPSNAPLFDPRHLIFALGQLGNFNTDVRPAMNSSLNANTQTPKPLDFDKDDKQPQKRPAIPDEAEVSRLLAAKKRKLNGLFNNSVEEKWRREIIDNQQQILDGQQRLSDQIQAYILNLNRSNSLSSLSESVDKLCTVLTSLHDTLRVRNEHEKSATPVPNTCNSVFEEPPTTVDEALTIAAE